MVDAPQTPPPATTPTPLPLPEDAQTARVAEIAERLQNLARALRLEERVIRAQQNTVTVRTEQGDITLIVRGRDVPQQGDQVEVDLAAGRPPRQAVIRELPSQPQQQTPAPNPPPQTGQTAPPAPTTGQTPPKAGDTPQAPQQQNTQQPPPSSPARAAAALSPDIARVLDSGQSSPALPRPLTSGDTIRVVPLPSSDISNIVFGNDSNAPVSLTPAVDKLLAAAKLFSQLPPPDLLRPLEGHPDIKNPQSLANAPSPPPTVPAEKNAVFQPLLKAFANFLRPADATPPQISANSQTAAPTTPQQPAKIFGLPQAPLTPEIARPVGVPSLTADIAKPIGVTTQSVLATAPAPLTLRLTNIVPPGVVVPEPKINPSAPPIMQAHVIGTTPQKLPVIAAILPGNSEPVLFTVPFRAPNLTPGTTLQFTLQQPAAAPQTGAPLPPLGPPEWMQLALPVWPEFDDMAQTIRAADPQAYQSLMRASVPNATIADRIPAAALLFIAAARGGDIAGWLGGKNTDLLRRAGRLESIGNIERDSTMTGRSEQAGAAGEWRSVSIPMGMQDQISRMMLHYHQDQESDGSDDEDRNGTRFIFDLNMTRMGPVQIDGFQREQKLDLIIRTRENLSPGMQQRMKQLWHSALEASNMTGEMSFQSKMDQFIKIEAPKTHRNMTA